MITKTKNQIKELTNKELEYTIDVMKIANFICSTFGIASILLMLFFPLFIIGFIFTFKMVDKSIGFDDWLNLANNELWRRSIKE